jgi:hypothetical protein
MSLQTIIDRAQTIEIDRRRIVGQTISRSQRIKTSERATAQPWKFTVTPPAYLKWADSRGVIEVIDSGDRVNEYEISIGNTAGTNYITRYQGNLLQTQLDDLSVSSVGTSSLVISTLPSIGASAKVGLVSTTTVVLSRGDFIQPENSRYPYTVTSDVLRGSGSTVSVSLNRALITSEGITLTGNGVVVGNSCTWQVVISGLPSYQLTPMQLVQYTGNFELIERIV